ncbi:hypothetical protein Tco_0111038 [Tanacetum coccineum]
MDRRGYAYPGWIGGVRLPHAMWYILARLQSSYSLLLTSMCCDDAYHVTPRVSALTGCDRLVSEPLVIENHDYPTPRRYRWEISPRSVLEVEKKEEEEEEPKEEEEEPEKEVDPKEIELSPRPGVNLSQKKMALTRQRNSGNGGNPDIAAVFAQQLQNIIPQIVMQVTNNVNNANGNGGNTNDGNRNGGNNGCSYKEFLAYNQRVKYAASSFINKALTWWNTQVQTRGREAANEMTWESFKAFLVEEFFPSNEMEKLESEF